MKKLFLALSLVAATFFCQAQLFIGGDLGFGFNSGKVETKTDILTTTYDNPKTTIFEINPFVGYMFNEKFGVGLEVGYGISSVKTDAENDVTYKNNISTWKAAPFFRYVYGNFNRVKLFADAKVSFAGAYDNFITIVDNDRTREKGPKCFEWGVAVVPGIEFILNEHFSLSGKLNVLSIGYVGSKITTDSQTGFANCEVTEKSNTFGFGVNESTDIVLGMIYKF